MPESSRTPQARPQKLIASKTFTSVPSPELLKSYQLLGKKLPEAVMAEWSSYHRRAFIYATVSLAFGGLIALSLVGGFIYLVMNGHPKSAAALLGAGALGMVTGFRSIRLD
jgi:hypothetical protein